MKLRTRAGGVLIFAIIALILAQVHITFSILTTYYQIEGNSGTIHYPIGTRTLYFEDSFENETPRRFTGDVSSPPEDPPMSWGADMGSSIGAYCEITNSPEAVYDGNVGLYFYCPRAPENVTTVHDYIFTRLGYDQMADVFYVSWHQKFENMPATSSKSASIFVMTSRTGLLDTAQTAEITISKESVSINKMYDDGNYSSTQAQYTLETNKWYHFAAMYKYSTTNGEYHLWIDNRIVISLTGMNSTPFLGLDYRPAGFEIGLLSRIKDEDYSGWLDDVLAANYPVGYVFKTSFEPDGKWAASGTYGGHWEMTTMPEPVYNGEHSIHNWGLRNRLFTNDSLLVILGTYDYEYPNGTRIHVANAVYGGNDYYTASADQGHPVYVTLQEALDIGVYDYYRYKQNGEVRPVEILGQYEWEFSHLLVKNYTDGGKQDAYWWSFAYPRGRIGPQDYGTIGSFSELYMRIYVNYRQLEGYHQLLRFYGSSVYIATAQVSGGAITLSMGDTQSDTWYPYDQSGAKVTEAINYSVQLNMNEWHSLELHFKKSAAGVYDGGGQIWLDGSLVVSRMNLDTSQAPNIATIVTGLVLCNSPLDFYVDGWVVATNYIGP